VAKQKERLVDNGNIGAFYANNKYSFKSAIGALKIVTALLLTIQQLKLKYCSVFTKKFTFDSGTIPSTSDLKVDNELGSITFTSLLVLRAIKRLKIKTKGQPDGIPPIFLKMRSSV